MPTRRPHRAVGLVAILVVGDEVALDHEEALLLQDRRGRRVGGGGGLTRW